jgi:hypothetical protein
MIDEAAKSPSRPRTYLVNPRYGEIRGGVCYPALADLPEPADLALLAVPDAALEEQVRTAAGGRRAVAARRRATSTRSPPTSSAARPWWPTLASTWERR